MNRETIKRFALLVMVLSLATTTLLAKSRYKYSDSKKIEKSFSVDSDVILELNIKYADVKIIEGNSNKVEVVVDIEVSTKDEKSLEVALNRYRVDFKTVGKRVVISGELQTTKMSKRDYSVRLKTLYTIKVPKNYQPQVNMKYGDIIMGDVYKSAKFDVEYGSITANTFNEDVFMLMKYSNLEANAINGDENNIDIKYGEAEIKNARHIQLTGSYSDVAIDRVKSVTVNGFFYGDIDIEHLAESFISENSINYSEVNINIGSEIKSVKIASSKFTDISIEHPADVSFNAFIKGSYIGTSIKGRYDLRKSNNKNNSVETEFSYGTSNSGATIEIYGSYADIVFRKE